MIEKQKCDGDCQKCLDWENCTVDGYDGGISYDDGFEDGLYDFEDGMYD